MREKLTVIRGLDCSRKRSRRRAASAGMAMLTGWGLNPGMFVGGDGQLAGWAKASRRSRDREARGTTSSAPR